MAIVEIRDTNFNEEALEANLPVFVDFWAPRCPPCRTAEPVIEELAKEYEGKIKIGKINVDQDPQIAQKYRVMSIPTVIIFKEGKEVKRQVGFSGKEGYEKLIEEILSTKS